MTPEGVLAVHRLVVFGSPLVAGPLSEYLAVIGYDVSSHPTHELGWFANGRPHPDSESRPADLVIVDLPVCDPERQIALHAMRQLRSAHGIPGVVLLDSLGDGTRHRTPEISAAAEAVLPKPLRFSGLAAVCSRVIGTAG